VIILKHHHAQLFTQWLSIEEEIKLSEIKKQFCTKMAVVPIINTWYDLCTKSSLLRNEGMG
jgi:hypothetical protein